MPRVNIYVNNDNYPDFEKEENKSGLINQLLSDHYAGEEKIRSVVQADKVAVAAFNDQLTCKAGHPSRDGKSCSNIKCSYFGG